MAPNKQWMQLVDNRLDEAYLLGVQRFLGYAFRRTGELYEIRCPCVKCCNTTLGTRETVKSHLKVYGIIQNYTFWYHHGEVLGESQSDSEDEDDNELEESDSEDEIQEILRDFYPNHDVDNGDTGGDDLHEQEPSGDFKGVGSSKAELISELLHSTREENKFLKDRLATIESEMNEIRKFKEMFLSQQSHVQPPSSPGSRESQ